MPEFDVAIDQSVDCMVATQSHLFAGTDFSAALTHDNAASGHQLTIVTLDAKHLGLAISTIARTTHTFFMCHELFLRAAFSIFSFRGAASARLFAILSLGCSSLLLRCRCLRSLQGRGLFLLNGGLFHLGSLASDQALAVGYNIIDGQHAQFLAMTTAMAVALL